MAPPGKRTRGTFKEVGGRRRWPPAEGDGGLRLPADGLSFERVERDLVAAALERADGNKSRAARLLGMDRDWIRHRAAKHGLDRPGRPGRPRET